MARQTFESLKVVWLTSAPANQSAPTQAEINAGTNLSAQIPVDGINKGGTANNASQAMLGDAFVAEQPGTWGRTLEVTFLYDTAATPWTLFAYNTEGYFIFAPTGSTLAGQKVETWHVKAHEKQPTPSAENEFQKFTVTFAVTEAPKLNATAAA